MTKHCPACAGPVIGAYGDEDSDILFIGSEPSDDEMRYGRPFTGQAFHTLKKELFKYAHIDLGATRQIDMWYHQKCKKVDCLNVSLSLVEPELEGKKFVILVGAEAVQHFTGLSVDDVNGLDVTNVVAPELVDGLDRKFFAIHGPNQYFHAWGEMRFALNNLDKWMKEE